MFEWNGDDVAESLVGAMMYGATHAAAHYRDQLYGVLSAHDGPPPSDPYTPPHMQSAMAARDGVLPLAETLEVVEDYKNLEVSVGTACEYAVYLEFGTSKMAPRPAWNQTLEQELGPMEEIFNAAASFWFEENCNLPAAEED